MFPSRKFLRHAAVSGSSRRSLTLEVDTPAGASRPNSWLGSAKCFVVGLAVAIFAGCGEDEIRHYKAVRLEQPKPAGRGALPPGHPPVSPRTGPSAAKPPALKYTVPEGWKEVPSTSEFRVASFEVGSDGKRADVSISPFAGTAGGLLRNVNRWRYEQLGLDPIDEEQLRSDLRQIEVAGSAGNYIELVGPESSGSNRQSILGVILARDNTTWFFKITGPTNLVAQQKSAFEEFVRSVRFE